MQQSRSSTVVQSVTNFFNILPPRHNTESNRHPFESNPSQALAQIEAENFSVSYRMSAVKPIIEQEKNNAMAYLNNNNQNEAINAFKKYKRAETEHKQLQMLWAHLQGRKE